MTWRLCATGIGLGVALGACASGPALTRDALVGTRWTERCPDAEIATAYIRLEPDASLAWSYTDPDSLVASDVHGWRVEAGELYVAWNLGGAVSRYRRERRGPLVGSSTFCSEATTLVPTL